MRTSLRTELPQWVLIAGMFALAAVTWSSAPDRIPIHWDVSGQPDDYAGKFVGLLGLPMMAVGLYLLLRVLPRVDPLGVNYAKFENVYLIVRYATLILLVAIYGLINLWIRDIKLDFSVIVPVLVGALFVVLGNYLGKVRQNWFLGIRTPWTLTSSLSWVKTHRLGGWLLVAVGSAIVVSGLAGFSWTAAFILVSLAATALLLAVYSYLIWRSDPEVRPSAGWN
ncbi:SdpI family protein [soil metagenome]